MEFAEDSPVFLTIRLDTPCSSSILTSNRSNGLSIFDWRVDKRLAHITPAAKKVIYQPKAQSEGAGAFPSLARRVNMQQHAELPCRGNKRKMKTKRLSGIRTLVQ